MQINAVFVSVTSCTTGVDKTCESKKRHLRDQRWPCKYRSVHVSAVSVQGCPRGDALVDFYSRVSHILVTFWWIDVGQTSRVWSDPSDMVTRHMWHTLATVEHKCHKVAASREVKHLWMRLARVKARATVLLIWLSVLTVSLSVIGYIKCCTLLYTEMTWINVFTME